MLYIIPPEVANEEPEVYFEVYRGSYTDAQVGIDNKKRFVDHVPILEETSNLFF